MAARIKYLALASLVLLAGCAGETFAPDDAPEFVVVRDRTPVYRLGPQQAAPPEERLGRDERVRLLRREFGYSYALLADGRSGYVANEDLAPAAPRPVVTPRPVEPSRERPPDHPAVEPPLPEPDLEAAPADGPTL